MAQSSIRVHLVYARQKSEFGENRPASKQPVAASVEQLHATLQKPLARGLAGTAQCHIANYQRPLLLLLNGFAPASSFPAGAARRIFPTRHNGAQLARARLLSARRPANPCRRAPLCHPLPPTGGAGGKARFPLVSLERRGGFCHLGLERLAAAVHGHHVRHQLPRHRQRRLIAMPVRQSPLVDFLQLCIP